MVDEINKKILNLLNEKPFITQQEIAQELGLTRPTIYSRLQKMKEEGTFRGYAPIIDLEKLGYGLTALVNIKIKNAKNKEAAALLATDPNVCSVYDRSGEFDLLVIARFHNVKELDEWDNKLLKETEMIASLNTSIAFNTPKETTNPNKIE